MYNYMRPIYDVVARSGFVTGCVHNHFITGV